MGGDYAPQNVIAGVVDAVKEFNVPIALTGVKEKVEKELSKFDVVIVDTAGRDSLSDELILELNDINKVVNAEERILVMAADVGQGAKQQAQTFHDTIGVTGVIITKLDGTAKGGIIFAIAKQLQIPIRFIGVGEGIDDLRPFDANEFVNALFETTHD